MARGRDLHDARQQALARLGKDLSRRAGSTCELCGGRQGCRPVEIPPLPESPTLEATALLCDRCRTALDARRLPGNLDDYRFLETSAWSDVAPVQIAAVRLLRRVADGGAPWARETLDGLWLPDDVRSRLDG